MEIITYGIFVNKENFRYLTEEREKSRSWLNKPVSCGLWGSPIHSGSSWKRWCYAEEFKLSTFNRYTKWKIKNINKILIIDSAEDLIKATNKYGILISWYKWILDYWKIKKDGYDGVWLTEKGNRECHSSFEYNNGYTDLNSWDCDSIVVWNWNQIQIIEKGRIYDKTISLIKDNSKEIRDFLEKEGYSLDWNWGDDEENGKCIRIDKEEKQYRVFNTYEDFLKELKTLQDNYGIIYKYKVTPPPYRLTF